MGRKKTKKELKQVNYEQSKQEADYWLRHEIGLGTFQIRKLWKRIDVIFKEAL